jgi:hypothetical protein
LIRRKQGVRLFVTFSDQQQAYPAAGWQNDAKFIPIVAHFTSPDSWEMGRQAASEFAMLPCCSHLCGRTTAGDRRLHIRAPAATNHQAGAHAAHSETKRRSRIQNPIWLT